MDTYTIVCEIWTHGIELESKEWVNKSTKQAAYKKARAWFKDAFIDPEDPNLIRDQISENMEQWVYDN